MVRRIGALLALAAVISGCATTRPGASTAGSSDAAVVQVVAAENFWGSIAAQIGGPNVHVVIVISSPDADPHDYEPTAADARMIDAADVVIGNGIGYDPWFARLVSASTQRPQSVDVGRVAGLAAGDNPHQWYSPTVVDQVIDRITSAFQAAAPTRATQFATGRTQFEAVGLKQYRALTATMRTSFAGVPVGASESIFAPLAAALGLDLVTPSTFLAAISEGTDPTAADKATVDRQIVRRQIRVWVYNSQNATPDIARLTTAARAQGIPVVTITETLTPAGATFQAWQSAQLEQLQAALQSAKTLR